MKFYIASRLKHKSEVKKLIKKLEAEGHSCVHDWTDGKRLKPYEENLHQSQKVADKQVRAIKDCDLFVLLNPDKGGTGMYVELGVALAEGKHTFVVGKCEKPMFLFHPSVKQVPNIEELFREILDISTLRE